MSITVLRIIFTLQISVKSYFIPNVNIYNKASGKCWQGSLGEQKDSFLTPTTLKNHKREGGQRGIEDTSLEKQCRLLLRRVAEKRAVLVGKWDQKFPYKVARISLTDP